MINSSTQQTLQIPVDTDFGFDTTAEQALNGVDLSGKIIVVTGANTGLGKETSRVLASAGATVILAVRNPATGQAAADDIARSVGASDLVVHALDLGSRHSIKAFAEWFHGTYDKLDILINNAGIMAVPEAYVEGMESQMRINYAGHMMLSSLLAPALLKAAPARVVTLTSTGHQIADIDLNDINFESGPYDPMIAYGRSKTASALLAVELDTQLGSQGVSSLAVHPGVIAETDLSRSMSDDLVERVVKAGASVAKTIPTGAATTVWAATAEQLAGKGVLYLEDCHVASLLKEKQSMRGVMPYALDKENAHALWIQMEDLLGESFPL